MMRVDTFDLLIFTPHNAPLGTHSTRSGASTTRGSLSACSASSKGLLEEALWVYGNNRDNLPSLWACNAILAGLAKAKRLSSSLELYTEIVSRGFEPDFITYGILINAHCREGDLFNARQISDEMSWQRHRRKCHDLHNPYPRPALADRSRGAVFERMRNARVSPSE